MTPDVLGIHNPSSAWLQVCQSVFTSLEFLPRGKSGLAQFYPRGKTGLAQSYPLQLVFTPTPLIFFPLYNISYVLMHKHNKIIQQQHMDVGNDLLFVISSLLEYNKQK